MKWVGFGLGLDLRQNLAEELAHSRVRLFARGLDLVGRELEAVSARVPHL